MSKVPDDLKKLSAYMDSKYGVGGLRFGWDGIIGLVPGVGDFFTSGISLYIVIRSVLLGCSPSVLLRMGGNILIENVFDLIPIVGNLIDFGWKANNKNIVLLESYLENPTRATLRSRIWVALTLIFLIVAIVGAVIGAVYIVRMIFYQITG